MKTSLRVLALVLGLLAPRLHAADEPKVPSPEQKKLEIVTGKWRYEDTVVATPFGPAGIGRYTANVRFVHDGFFVVEEAKGKGPEGKTESWTMVQWYDTQARTYRTWSCGNGGNPTPSTMTLEGDVVTSNWEQKKDDKTYQCRAVTRFAPDHRSSTYVFTYSQDGSVWLPWITGKGTRTGKAR